MKQGPMKISIRFFYDREVRAIWDDEYSKWWFSVLDIVGVLNEEPVEKSVTIGNTKKPN